jgi:hypothetical protein
MTLAVKEPTSLGRLRWHLRRGLIAHATEVKAGVAGAVIAVVLLIGVAVPESRQLAQLREEAARSDTPVAKPAPAVDPQQRLLAHFTAQPLVDASSGALLDGMARAAAVRAVRVDTVTKRPRVLSELGLAAVELDTTLLGDYAAIRGLTRDLLRAQPQLGIESMAFAREGGRVKAEVKWVLVGIAPQAPMAQRAEGRL